MDATPLLARLHGVRLVRPGRWMARCPAHDDRSPSLSVRDTGDRVLIYCWAGCDSDAVIGAAGLRWADLYPDPWRCAAARPNEGARAYARRVMAQADPMDFERRILAIAAADLRAGRALSAEDRARVAVAQERLAAAQEVPHGR